MKAHEVKKEAREAGISEKSLRRGRERLGIKPRKSAFEGGWEWGLTEDAPSSQDAHPKTEGTLGDTGHLGGDSEVQKSIFADDG